MRKTNFCGEGWVYFNPDVGTEYAKNHPKRSGECSDAEDIRRSTEMEDLLHAELDRLRTAPPVQMEAVAPRLLEISSAPKDGTHILGLTQWGWREVWYKRDYCEGEYWTDEGDSEPEPTHWAPLPDASPVPSSERDDIIEKAVQAEREAILALIDEYDTGGYASHTNMVIAQRTGIEIADLIRARSAALSRVSQPAQSGEEK